MSAGGGVFVAQPDISRECCGGTLFLTFGIFASFGSVMLGAPPDRELPQTPRPDDD